MTNSRITFIAVLTVATSLSAWFYIYTNPSALQVSKSKIDTSLKKLPRFVINAAIQKSFEVNAYQKGIADLDLDKSKHIAIAQKLYDSAFTHAQYSEMKLRLLQQAKEHLILAKRLKG